MKKKNRPLFNELKEKLKNDGYKTVVLDGRRLSKKEIISLMYLKYKYGQHVLFIERKNKEKLKGIR